MKQFLLAVIVFSVIGCTASSGNNSQPKQTGHHSPASQKTMHAFRSEQELAGYLKQLADKQERRGRAEAQASAAPAAKMADSNGLASSESVTNVQHAGVDEGGIVKVHGNQLVVLRRGRLFTVSIADGGLTPISSVDAFGPDIDPSGTWYDEMLVSDDTVAVIGYSYQRGGTEVGLFQIDPAAKLR